MLRNWRAWILLILFGGPVLIYMGLGGLWLYRARLGGFYAFSAWVTAGDRLRLPGAKPLDQGPSRELLPPIDLGRPRDVRPARPPRSGEPRPGGVEPGRDRADREPPGVRYLHRHRPGARHPPGGPLPPTLDEPDREHPGRRGPRGPGAGRRGPDAPLPPDPRRRPGDLLALEKSRSRLRIPHEGQRDLRLPPADLPAAHRPRPPGDAEADGPAGLEEHAAEPDAVVLRRLHQSAGDSPDRAV